jgi:hypothetical protein
MRRLGSPLCPASSRLAISVLGKAGSGRWSALRVRFDELNMYHAIPKVHKKSGGEFIFIYRGWVVSRAYIYNEKAMVVWGKHHCTRTGGLFLCQSSPPEQIPINPGSLVKPELVR